LTPHPSLALLGLTDPSPFVGFADISPTPWGNLPPSPTGEGFFINLHCISPKNLIILVEKIP